jgi:Fic family protein
LIKLAIIHHQFESIHPFYDGNGRTGRIISVLYLVQNRLLDLPILYLSRYITRNKADYYKLIQAVRDNDGDIKDWQNWVMFILKGIEVTSKETIILINGISQLMAQYKAILKPVFGKTYKHELLNNLFFHPYTKIEFIERDMNVQRKTAAKYLDMIVDLKLLTKMKKGPSNYYINDALFELFLNQGKVVPEVESIESVKS